MNKLLYYFGSHGTEGNASMKQILGTKGANLAQMCQLGIPVPPGFTISSKIFLVKNIDFLYQLEDILMRYISKLESETGKIFGCTKNPLLVSVRSGAAVSMPGMMDTILNLGMNDQTAEALAIATNNPRFAYDTYRRFIEMYGSVVLKLSKYLFEEVVDIHKATNNIISDQDLTYEILQEIIHDYKKIILKYTGKQFESNVLEQLKKAIKAVLVSWMSDRAMTYRKINNIADDIGTAVNIQSMVFGNKCINSATGVIFTRCPSTGKNELFGEFLINAQGEDVVSGTHTPYPIVKSSSLDNLSMQEQMPIAYQSLKKTTNILEKHFQDMQDVEFTIESGNLYILQTRNGKRSASAAIQIAIDMHQENIITKEEALMRIEPESLNKLLHTTIDYSNKYNVIATGLPASPGAAQGIVVFSSQEAAELAHSHKVILLRNDTSPEDIKGMDLAQAIITARGGMTSHAAVVARGMGKPCICGVKGLVINEKQKICTTSSGYIIKHKDFITIDGATGDVMIGDIKFIEPNISDAFHTILQWADEVSRLKVRANAETTMDAKSAIRFGAIGIGLCRTEHMFFDTNKISLVREMIIAENLDKRKAALNKLQILQTHDFKSIFEVMHDKPINIRLLDPPLHEFLPDTQEEIEKLSNILGVSISVTQARIQTLHELNPMLGHRGCRLGISSPEIYIMQVEAILNAMHTISSERKIQNNVELMIPLISDINELKYIKQYTLDTIRSMEAKYSMKFNIKIGTMIELPRAALISDQIAKDVEYFSFGSNDLTQTTFGMSRDDIGSFLPDYIDKKIFAHDPFVTLDQEGVGKLIEMSISKGKKVNPHLTFGICGEHAGNPESIDFLHKIGVAYISCSPYRVPIARIAAAQSHIKSLREAL